MHLLEPAPKARTWVSAIEQSTVGGRPDAFGCPELLGPADRRRPPRTGRPRPAPPLLLAEGDGTITEAIMALKADLGNAWAGPGHHGRHGPRRGRHAGRSGPSQTPETAASRR